MIMKEHSFDNEQYLIEQSEYILQRVKNLTVKTYLEFGGKLLNDFHAARVMPGYDPNVKIHLLKKLARDAEIILCVHSGAIERRKIRADYGITYDVDAMKLIDDLEEWDLSVTAVVITRWENFSQTKTFLKKLENRGICVHVHKPIEGYPEDIAHILSENGFGSNTRIETTKPLVVVTGPGPGSGKLATCLSQIYHDTLHGIPASYAKFETFPIWNLPLDHPVNIAYEAATLDLGDYNLIDPFHSGFFNEHAVSYNRDVEAFPVIKTILSKLTKNNTTYHSPTEMGVNRAGFAITNDSAVREAARQEIIRRYLRCACEFMMGAVEKDVLEKASKLMNNLGLDPSFRRVVPVARRAAKDAEKNGTTTRTKKENLTFCGAALELHDGQIVNGKNSKFLNASTAAILNAIKILAGVPDHVHLLSPQIIESIAMLKKNIPGGKNTSMDVDETLTALGISAAMDPVIKACVNKLSELNGCPMHLTHIPSPGDEAGLRRLGLDLTSDAVFASSRLYSG